MLTDPKLKSQVDQLWDKFWTGGLTNPMDAIEQFSYLLFLKHLDDAKNRKQRIVHVVAYHPRRSLQSIPHADQSWPTSGLSFKLRLGDRASHPDEGFILQQVYLAPGRQPLDHRSVDGYLLVDLPPVNAHAVVVIE